MAASTASACLRRLSDCVNSVRRAQGPRPVHDAPVRVRHLSMDFFENSHWPSCSMAGMRRLDGQELERLGIHREVRRGFCDRHGVLGDHVARGLLECPS